MLRRVCSASHNFQDHDLLRERHVATRTACILGSTAVVETEVEAAVVVI